MIKSLRHIEYYLKFYYFYKVIPKNKKNKSHVCLFVQCYYDNGHFIFFCITLGTKSIFIKQLYCVASKIHTFYP